LHRPSFSLIGAQRDHQVYSRRSPRSPAND
jgi:hypothetical protein